jgi:type II secretory pathway pseudopilin PulG
LLELILALAIFAMIMAAIYSTWSAILRSVRVGDAVAATAQRTRLTSRTLEDALLSAVMFQANGPLYSFDVDTSSDFAWLSFVSRLPESFPGSGYFAGAPVRRVEFAVEAGTDGTNDLVLRQLPLLAAETPVEKQHSIVLARDVSLFTVEFLGLPGTPAGSGARAGEWQVDWPYTNALPWVVRFTLAFGRNVDKLGRPADLAIRTVYMPSVIVPAQSSQGAANAAQPINPQPGGDAGQQDSGRGGGRFGPGGQPADGSDGPRGPGGGGRGGGGRGQGGGGSGRRPGGG